MDPLHFMDTCPFAFTSTFKPMDFIIRTIVVKLQLLLIIAMLSKFIDLYFAFTAI